ncbi:MAG: TATA-box-binding protein [Promethearchaeota archaeon]|jgi:transcription initiation factor TFIID TATA-box-binding protein|nr:MAG: TATA-box-binding protein [Candidatus Lokiarchaeota archaeon]
MSESEELDIKSLYKVVNIVASVQFEIEGGSLIDLNLIALKNKNTEYNPDTFPGLILRLQKPKSTVLVFSTGKLVITGLRKTEDVNPVTAQVIKILKKSRINIVGEPNIVIQNIVASGDLGININLNLMSISLMRALYEPEVFPGLIYRMENPKVVFLIFASGKIVCVGAKSEEFIQEAVKKLLNQIQDLDFEM